MPGGIVLRSGSEPADWSAQPIKKDWVLSGSPVARIQFVSGSVDGTASTYFWDCTAGRFNWFYSFDETLHILEGSVSLKFLDGSTQRAVAGDMVFFPAGSQAEWTVDNYIRKVAFCRTPLPGVLVMLRQVVRRLRQMARGNFRDVPAPAMFSTD